MPRPTAGPTGRRARGGRREAERFRDRAAAGWHPHHDVRDDHRYRELPQPRIGHRRRPRPGQRHLLPRPGLARCLTGQVAYPGHGVAAAVARLHHPPTIPTDLPPGWAPGSMSASSELWVLRQEVKLAPSFPHRCRRATPYGFGHCSCRSTTSPMLLWTGLQGARLGMMPEHEDVSDSLLRLVPVHAELNLVAALLAAAPALNPSRGARSRMRRRLHRALLPNPDASQCVDPSPVPLPEHRDGDWSATLGFAAR